jgi:hypothetical protein
MCELEPYAKVIDGFITIDLPHQLHEQLSKQWEREPWQGTLVTPPRRQGNGMWQLRPWQQV